MAIVIPHHGLPSFPIAGATITGIATAGMGAKEYEVWRSTIAPHAHTIRHKHDTEEIFVFLSGKGKVIVGEVETPFEAPCTIICPAHIEHQFFNVGDEPSDQIVILGIASTIVDADHAVMHLPWRN
ncbi:MAG: cupin domain-containing protein [Chlamydiia bacterium]|nr:cupin domain-containing protein [Chlamydiia bacterium]